jgi:hypothetical protein
MPNDMGASWSFFRVFNTIVFVYENEFQNPQIFHQVFSRGMEVTLDASAGMNFCLAQLDGSAQVTVMRVIGVAPKLVTSECNRVLRCSYPLPSRCTHLELHVSHLNCIKRHSTTPPTDTHMF